MLAATHRTVSLPTLLLQEEALSPSGWYVILSDTNTRWSTTTNRHETLEECYVEALEIVRKQFRLRGDDQIGKTYHGQWPEFVAGKQVKQW